MSADLRIRTAGYSARDGVTLTYREVGAGRPVVLVHGFLMDPQTTWIAPGHATLLARAGRRVVMPELRGHGRSQAPLASFTADVITDDVLALVDALGLTDGAYDLVGYSLGARTVLRMLVRGARPGRAVLGGTGLEPMLDAFGRGALFRRAFGADGHAPGSPEARARAELARVGAEPRALLAVLDSLVATRPEDVAALDVPTLVVAGDRDDTHGSVTELTALLRDARLVLVPGGHASAAAAPELGRAIAAFLDEAS